MCVGSTLMETQQQHGAVLNGEVCNKIIFDKLQDNFILKQRLDVLQHSRPDLKNYQNLNNHIKLSPLCLLKSRIKLFFSRYFQLSSLRRCSSSVHCLGCSEYSESQMKVNPLLFGLFSAEIYSVVKNWFTSMFERVRLLYKSC